MVWPFIPQLKVGHTAQFLVDQREQGVEGVAVTTPPYLQQLRDLAWAGADPGSAAGGQGPEIFLEPMPDSMFHFSGR